jgi:hypothetical protein
MKFVLVTNLDNNKKILTKDIGDAIYVMTEYPNSKMEEVELYLKPIPKEVPDIKTLLK